MRRVDRQRREQREHVGEEMLFEPDALGLLEIGTVDQRDADGGKLWPQFDPALLLVVGERRDRLADAGQLLRRRKAVRALGGNALPDLADKAGHTHHEEFVEVIGRDRQETHPLQHRVVLVGGLFQHPAIKVQPGQFAVDEAFRLRARRDFKGGFRLSRSLAGVPRRSDFLFCCKCLCAIRHLGNGSRKSGKLTADSGGRMTVRAR